MRWSISIYATDSSDRELFDKQTSSEELDSLLREVQKPYDVKSYDVLEFFFNSELDEDTGLFRYRGAFKNAMNAIIRETNPKVNVRVAGFEEKVGPEGTKLRVYDIYRLELASVYPANIRVRYVTKLTFWDKDRIVSHVNWVF